ncbi:hypothetical protein THAOC_31935 [Thalassiosira oceanica]|uniref:Uncharacterized protein n=1 Tax=Thalassiosira oceanica TaxID=159749 RepID=K0RAE7_THAOC|nr:hypothetical protein THAOC_31935 [Thalassiosira oceanica]|eukprot:EJK49214.1 hypothetical protein THAOC_31935 [Thalassiosira oceanica]
MLLRSLEPDVADEDWDDLNGEQKAAAEVLGYTKASWDKDDGDGKQSSGAKYENYDWKEVWSELTRLIEQLWDNDEDPEEQEAAKILGYTKETWEADDSAAACCVII